MHSSKINVIIWQLPPKLKVWPTGWCRMYSFFSAVSKIHRSLTSMYELILLTLLFSLFLSWDDTCSMTTCRKIRRSSQKDIMFSPRSDEAKFRELIVNLCHIWKRWLLLIGNTFSLPAQYCSLVSGLKPQTIMLYLPTILVGSVVKLAIIHTASSKTLIKACR